MVPQHETCLSEGNFVKVKERTQSTGGLQRRLSQPFSSVGLAGLCKQTLKNAYAIKIGYRLLYYLKLIKIRRLSLEWGNVFRLLSLSYRSLTNGYQSWCRLLLGESDFVASTKRFNTASANQNCCGDNVSCKATAVIVVLTIQIVVVTNCNCHHNNSVCWGYINKRSCWGNKVIFSLFSRPLLLREKGNKLDWRRTVR